MTPSLSLYLFLGGPLSLPLSDLGEVVYSSTVNLKNNDVFGPNQSRPGYMYTVAILDYQGSQPADPFFYLPRSEEAKQITSQDPPIGIT